MAARAVQLKCPGIAFYHDGALVGGFCDVFDAGDSALPKMPRHDWPGEWWLKRQSQAQTAVGIVQQPACEVRPGGTSELVGSAAKVLKE
jgi:hypothetical protein